jgi:hypothetical protein
LIRELNKGAYVKIKNTLNDIKVISIKKLDEWCFHQKTLVWAIHPCPKGQGFLANER